jgi:hypothetical protein
MTGPVEERTYRWPRRYAFAATLAVLVTLLLVLWLVA